MKRPLVLICFAGTACGLVAGLTSSATAGGGQGAALVRLQATTPGSPQTGHINITGTVRTGSVLTDNVFGFTSVMAGPPVGTFIAAPAASSIGMFTSGVERVRVDPTGNVGIGTISPAYALQVNAVMGSGSGLDGGMAFMHSNQTQGIGFGFNTIYATGTNPSQSLGLRSRGGGTIELNASGGFVHSVGNLYVDEGLGGAPEISLAVGDSVTGINSAGQGALDVYANGTNVVNVRETGVTVNGGIDAISSILARSGALIVARTYNSGGYGISEWSSPSGFRTLYAGAYGGGLGFIGALNDTGTTGTGGVLRTGDTTTTVFATSKSFVEPNPDDLSTDIVYTCIEGPEAAMYCRGTGTLVNGRAHIDLPRHFRTLAEEGTLTVLLTPLSLDTRGMGVAQKNLAGIEVGEIAGGTGSFDFDWEVKAVRKRFKSYKVDRPWTDRLIGGGDPKKAWQDRLESFRKDQEQQKQQP